MFNENDEVRNKRIRKRKAVRLNSPGSRRKWKVDLKTVVKQRDYGFNREMIKTGRDDDCFFSWLDKEEPDSDSSRSMC